MNNIKHYRLELGLTQKEIADFLGVTQAILSKYESNSRQPSFEICIKLIKLLKLKGINASIEDIRSE